MRRCAILWATLLPLASLAQEPTNDSLWTLPSRWADQSHALIDNSTDQLVRYLDYLLGDKSYQEEAGYLLRWENRWRLGEAGERVFDQRVRASVNLPKTENRLALVFDSEDDEVGTDSSDRLLESPSTVHQTRVGLRLSALRTEHSKVTASASLAGGRFSSHLRWRYRQDLDHDRTVRAEQRIYWRDNEDGWGGRSELSYSRALNPQTLLRYQIDVESNEATPGTEVGLSATAIKRISEHSTWSVQVSADGHSAPATVVDNYQLAVGFRRNLWRPWFFVQLVGAVDWLQPSEFNDHNVALNHRNASASLTASMEIHFSSELEQTQLPLR